MCCLLKCTSLVAERGVTTTPHRGKDGDVLPRRAATKDETPHWATCRKCLTLQHCLQTVKQRFINSDAAISLINVKICKYRTLFLQPLKQMENTFISIEMSLIKSARVQISHRKCNELGIN